MWLKLASFIFVIFLIGNESYSLSVMSKHSHFNHKVDISTLLLSLKKLLYLFNVRDLKYLTGGYFFIIPQNILHLPFVGVSYFHRFTCLEVLMLSFPSIILYFVMLMTMRSMKKNIWVEDTLLTRELNKRIFYFNGLIK